MRAAASGELSEGKWAEHSAALADAAAQRRAVAAQETAWELQLGQGLQAALALGGLAAARWVLAALAAGELQPALLGPLAGLGTL